MLFPEGQDGRIPIVAVTGVNGKTTTTRLHRPPRCAGSGQSVGMTCTDGIYIDGRRIEAGDCSGPRERRDVLLNPAVEAAVLETARGGILREGLGFDRCDVAVVTNIGEGDHLGLAGDRDGRGAGAGQAGHVVEAVAPDGRRGPQRRRPARGRDGRRTARARSIFFARDADHPVDRRPPRRRAAGPSSSATARSSWPRGRARPAWPPGRRAADPRRPDRLPGRERPGRGRRRLGPGPRPRRDPRRPGVVRSAIADQSPAGSTCWRSTARPSSSTTATTSRPWRPWSRPSSRSRIRGGRSSTRPPATAATPT